MLFSRVKISCFRVKAHLVLIFHWCLYNKIPYTYKIFRNPTEDHFKYSWLQRFLFPSELKKPYLFWKNTQFFFAIITIFARICSSQGNAGSYRRVFNVF